ncbi:MAG: DHA2 family efflux MFS transporter permease subunit [Coriobacteriales bacterium]
MSPARGVPAKGDPAGSGSLYALYAITVISSAAGNLSQTAVNAMLPGIAADFGVGVDVAQWVTTGYMLMLGLIVPLSTFLQRRVCMRTHILVSNVLFVVGALASLFAPAFWCLFVGRLMQAMSVGIMMPLMQTIAVTRFPQGRRATAMGVAGIAMGFAPNIGPTVGGAMDYAFGWRSFFVLLVAVGVALIVTTLCAVRRGEPMFPDARFDVLSFALSTLGFGGLLLGISNASSMGVNPVLIAGPIVAGALFLVAFFLRQKRIEQPLVHLSIFSSDRYVRGLVALMLHFGAFMGITLVIPLYVENLCGGTSLDAGMVLFPATFVALVMNPVGGIATDRFGVKPVCRVLVVVMLVGALAEATVDASTPLWLVALYQTVRAIGISGLIGPLQAWCLGGLEPRLVPDGSATAVLLRQAAASFGTSVMVLITEVVAVLDVPAALPYQLSFGFSALLVAVLAVFAFARVK